MQENEHAFSKIENAINRLHNRPVGERRALFFATFAVAVSLVFSVWTRHMYQRFGIAFSPGAVRQDEMEREETRQTAEENAATVPPAPLATLRENLATLRNGSVGFFSEIFLLLDRRSEMSPVEEEDGKKMPPVLGVYEEALPDDQSSPSQENDGNVPLFIGQNDNKENIASNETVTPALSSLAVNSGSSVAENDTQSFNAQFDVDAQKESPDAAKVVFVEVAAEETGVMIQTKTGQFPASTFRFYDVLKHNFETIRSGLSDFYEYLAR